jgi:hypothetical protein
MTTWEDIASDLGEPFEHLPLDKIRCEGIGVAIIGHLGAWNVAGVCPGCPDCTAAEELLKTHPLDNATREG